MDNSQSLRRAYGSSVLEDYNPQIYAYRRDVAGAITCILFAVAEALDRRGKNGGLPREMPSARGAYLRLVGRVRHIIEQQGHSSSDSHLSGQGTPATHEDDDDEAELDGINATHKEAVRQKFIAWSAAAAAQAELIEYLEELVELVRILAGENCAASSSYPQPIGPVSAGDEAGDRPPDDGLSMTQDGTGVMEKLGQAGETSTKVTRRTTYAHKHSEDKEEVPEILRRMQSRKKEAELSRIASAKRRGESDF